MQSCGEEVHAAGVRRFLALSGEALMTARQVQQFAANAVPPHSHLGTF